MCDAIIIGPGGIKGLVMLGALCCIEAKMQIHAAKYIAGVSIGSIIGILLTVGYNVLEILKIFMELKADELLQNVHLQDVLGEGVISLDPIKELLSKVIIEKAGMVPTLKQLFDKTGRYFVSVTYKIGQNGRGITEYQSHLTTPELSCVEAVIRSVAIPRVFKRIVDTEGNQYIDGAFGDPYPTHLFDNNSNRVIGISVRSDIKNDFDIVQIPFGSFRDFVISKASAKCKHIILQSNVKDPIGITLSQVDKLTLFMAGFRQCFEFLEQR